MNRRLLVRVNVGLPPAGEATVDWALRDQDRVLASGAGPLSRLPADVPVELVAAADCVTLTRVRLPQAPMARLRQMLAFAVEEQLLCDPAEVHAVLGPALDEGERAAAVLDRHWLTAWLSAFGATGRPVRRIWPESLLGALPAAEWLVVITPGGGFVRLAPAEALSLEAAPEGVPQVLLAAIAEARGRHLLPQRVRVRAAPGAPMPDVAAWQTQLEVPVEPDAAWDWRLADPAPPAFDLLQQTVPATGPGLAPRRLVMGALLLALLQFAAAGVDYARLAWCTQHLRAQMRATVRRVLPDSRLTFVRQTDVDQALAQLAARRRGARLYQDWVQALAGAMQAAAPGSHVDALHFDAEGLNAALDVPQQDMIDPLTQQLDTAGFIVSTDGVASTAGTAVQVSLSLKVKPD